MGFKVALLLIVSAALAVSIEFPSLVLSHPNTNPARMTLDELKGHSPSSSALVDAVSKMSDAKSADFSKLTFHPFPPSDRFFPQFTLSHPDTNPVVPPPQDSTSQSTSSSSLSDFYLKK